MPDTPYQFKERFDLRQMDYVRQRDQNTLFPGRRYDERYWVIADAVTIEDGKRVEIHYAVNEFGKVVAGVINAKEPRHTLRYLIELTERKHDPIT